MALNTNQQILETIKKSHHPLITFRKDWNGDALASSLALSLILKKIDKKQIDVVSDNFKTTKKYSFLPLNKVKPNLSQLKKFIISLDLKDNKIHDFSYNLENDKLHIYLTPEKNSLKKEDLNTSSSNYKYDTIITLNTPDLESLGKVYEDNREFFYQTPIINIDHHQANENFGQINLVDPIAASTTEILFNLLPFLGKNILDKDIATCLLTGLIVKTKSFKTYSVTPRTLDIASQLINAQAERETIIKYLYQTKTLETLKLWGRALSRLRYDASHKLAWSILSKEDFISTGSHEKDLIGIIEELIATSPEAEIIVLLYESVDSRENKICGFLYTEKNIDASLITKTLNSQGNRDQAVFCLFNKNLLEAEKEVIEEIKKNCNNLKMR